MECVKSLRTRYVCRWSTLRIIALDLVIVISPLGWIRAQSTNLYHTNRVFTPIAINAAQTRYSVTTMAGKLTEVIKGEDVQPISNETYATEYEAMAWGYESASEAWSAVVTNYALYSTQHQAGVYYDNAGWVKGTRQVTGPDGTSWGAYLWLLQNHIVFQSSTTTLWRTPEGGISIITQVLVRSLGDYEPEHSVTNVGPIHGPAGLHFTANPGANQSEELRMKPDLTTYYQVGVINVDLDVDTDNNGNIDADDSGEDKYEEYTPGRILCKNGYGIDTNTDYLAEIKLSVHPTMNTGTVQLDEPGNTFCTRVYTATNKTEEISLPHNWDISVTNLPSTLYVDGVATGQVQLALSYTGGGLAITDKVAVLIIPTISYAPGKGANAFIWAPLKTSANGNSANNLGWADATEFENQIKSQGWSTVTWFEDTTGDTDTNLGSCTFANYKGMTNCGIFTVTSHGDKGCHPAVYAEYTPAGLAVISNWCGGETGITIDPWLPDPNDQNWLAGCYVARVSSSWLSANWQSGMNANRAICLWSICYSATSNTVTGEDAVKECAGGRWRVGYVEQTYEQEDREVNGKFLMRLNGSTDNAQRRTAGTAWDQGTGYHVHQLQDSKQGQVNAKMDGNDWTTLCPAPLANNAVFPDTTAGNRKGWGCIIFDTYMCSTNAATDALLKTTGCPTTNHSWFGNADGYYGLGFDFDKTGGAATTMRAVADKSRNEETGGGREMDGDRVQPSKDNRDWSF